MTAPTVSDALVIGGGLAGASVALALAEAGRAVTILEKSVAAHPKVCGEFLSHEALHYLALAGVDPETLGAVPIEGVRLARDHIVAEARLPFRSMSLSRERLDEALLVRAASAGATVVRGRRVDALTGSGSEGWTARDASGFEFRAPNVVLATGKHDLHGQPRPPGRQNNLIGFKMYWRLAPEQQVALDHHVELIAFPGGYAGLQPVEDGMANLCLLVEKATLRSIGGQWPELLGYMTRRAAHLARRLVGAAAVWERPLALSSIPYGYLRTRSDDGVWRLGDQSAVIPSFAGDGMSIALHSARLAARAFLAGQTAEEYQRILARDLGRQVSAATYISRALVRLPSPLLVTARLFPSALTSIAGGTRIRADALLP